MQNKVTVGRKVLTLVVFQLLFQLAFTTILGCMLKQAETEAARQSRSRDIVALVNTTQKDLYLCLSALFTYFTSRSQKSEGVFLKCRSGAENDLYQLRRALVADNNKIRNRAQEQDIVRHGFQIMNRLDASLALLKNVDDGSQLFDRDKLSLNADMRREITAFINELDQIGEQERARLPQKQDAEISVQNGIFIAIIAGVTLNVLLVLSIAYFFNKSTGRRLQRLVDNTVLLASGQEMLAAQREDDDIGLLDRTLHQMAESLSESARKERAIVDNAQDVICSLDEEMKFSAVNPASQKLWGYAPEDLLGRRVIDVIQNEDKGTLVEMMKRVRTELTNVVFEARLVRPDQSLLHALWSSYWSGTEKSYFCVVHDITARKLAEELLKASEERIRSLVESMPVGLISITPEGIIETVNPMAERMFAFSARSLIGQPFGVLLSDKSKVKFPISELLERALASATEIEGLSATGQLLPIEISVSAFRIAAGIRYLAIVIDISERLENERLKRDFVAMVSHDLRTPLSSVQGFLGLLGMGAYGSISEQGMQRLALADRNVVRLLNLIKELLDIEKLESGMVEMTVDTYSSREILNTALESVRGYAEQQGVTLVDTAGDTSIVTDKERMVQVLVNLLSNAIKFSPREGTVTISDLKSDTHLEFAVADQGPGIPAEDQESIFQRFRQVGAREKRSSGSGLGLAICKAIVEQLGGKIGVESNVGEGSRFWIRLPFEQGGAQKSA
jgi:PAS domain S-box-containing protein